MTQPLNLNLLGKVGLVFSVYLSLSLIFWAPPHLALGSHLVDGGGGLGGSGLYIWVLQWWPYALNHGLNPFLETYTWYPHAQDLAWVTVGLAFPSTVLSPITALFGPVVTYNLIALFSPPLAATAMFLLVNHITKNPVAGALAGFFFGFSSYILGQLISHPNLYIVFLLPLAALLAVLFIEHRLQPRMFVVLLAALLAIQFTTSLEVFATASVVGCGTLLTSLIVYKNKVPQVLNLIYHVAYAYGLALIALVPYLYYLVAGLRGLPSTFNPPALYSADLLNYFVPTPISLLGGSQFLHVSSAFLGNYAEDGAYLGIPLIAILATILIVRRHSRLIRVLAVMLFVCVVASLGPYIHLDGRVISVGPWMVADRLPLLKDALPVRYALYVSFISALAVGLFISHYHTRFGAYLLVLVAAIFLIPNVGNNYWRSTTITSPVFSTDLYKRVIPPNSTLLMFPFSYQGPDMFYQAQDHFYYKLSDGFIGYIPRSIFRWPLLVETFYDHRPPLPLFKTNLMCYLQTEQVDYVAVVGSSVQRMYSPYLKNLTPVLAEKGTYLYKVPGSRQVHTECTPTPLSKVAQLLGK